MSASQIDTFSMCMRKWGWQYLEGVEPPKHRSAEVGIRVHKILEQWLSQAIPPNREERMFIDGREYEPGKIAEAGLHNLPPPGPHHDVEQSFMVPFMSGYPADWRGFIDSSYRVQDGPQHTQVLRHGTHGEVIVTLNDGSQVLGEVTFTPEVLDHKTTSNLDYRKLPSDLLTDAQALIYAWTAMHRTGAKRVNLRWVYYRTAKPYKSEVSFVTVTLEHVQKHLMLWEQLAINGPFRAKLMGLRAMHLPPNPGACNRYGGCPHKNVRCHLTPGEVVFASMSETNDLHAKIAATQAALQSGNVPGAPPPPLPSTMSPMLGQPLAPVIQMPLPNATPGAPPGTYGGLPNLGPPAPPAPPPQHYTGPIGIVPSSPQTAPAPHYAQVVGIVPQYGSTAAPQVPHVVQAAPPAPAPPPMPQKPSTPALPPPWHVHPNDAAWLTDGGGRFHPNTPENVAMLAGQAAFNASVPGANDPGLLAPPPPPAPTPPAPPAHYPSMLEGWPVEHRDNVLGMIRSGAPDPMVLASYPTLAPVLNQLRQDVATADATLARIAAQPPAPPAPPQSTLGLPQHVTPRELTLEERQSIASAIHQGVSDSQILAVFPHATAELAKIRLETQGPQRAAGINAPEGTNLPQLAQPSATAAPSAAPAAHAGPGDAFDAMNATALRKFAKDHGIDVKGLREDNLRRTVRNEARIKGLTADSAATVVTPKPAAPATPPQVQMTPAQLPWSPPGASPAHLDPAAIRRALDGLNAVGDILRSLIGAD